MARTRGVLFVFLLLLTGTAFGTRAFGQLRLPHLPKLPQANQLAVQLAAKRIAPFVTQQDPIDLNWGRVYPTTVSPPGGAFRPRSGQTSLADIDAQLARSNSGIVNLKPGDYEIPIRVYCSRVKAHSALHAPLVYEAGPLRGSRVDVLVAMLSKVTGARLPYSQVQPLGWAIATGMRYSQLSAGQRSLFDRLAPGMRSRISGNFIDQVRDQWNRLGIVGLPPFDSSLDSMGALGQSLKITEQAQSEIISQSNNFDALSASLVPPLDVSDRGTNYTTSPWGEVAPNIYMHTPSLGGTGALFTLQVRVTGNSGMSVPVPLLTSILYPTYCPGCQPLTYNVEDTGPKEDGGGGTPG
ncbi:MAG TPA: hypothetical protein VFW34_10720 [Candidatus Rubrimentiphilum sp.]|nr:hypothetical protein [Candidatus Rubrimentiphilum sp.]